MSPHRLAALIASGAVTLTSSAALAAKPDVTFMSRNLYLGADIIKLAAAKDTTAEAQGAAALFHTVEQTNFPLRAKAIAKEIKASRPDVIGLQEVARYYKNGAPAYDWMALLQKQLKAAGQSYRDVVEQTEIDIPTASADGYTLRLKLGNAILVRRGSAVHVTRGFKGIFTSQLSVPLPDQTVKLARGYAAIDATVAGTKFRFIDPHAEAYSDPDATGQFKELLATAAKSRTLPTVMAGDFNSSPTRGNAYNTVIAAGFVDTGVPAATCCQSETLDNPVSELDPAQWIDHIVARPKVKVLARRIVGNKAADRIGGLWPSDHAGLVATLRLG